MRVALQLRDQGISEMRYRELEYFCLQYGEKITLAASLAHTQADYTFDPTGKAVCRRDQLLHDVELIERAATVATVECGKPGLFDGLLRYVTRADKPPIDTLPCGRRHFYEVRRLFFCVLDVMLEDARGRGLMGREENPV